MQLQITIFSILFLVILGLFTSYCAKPDIEIAEVIEDTLFIDKGNKHGIRIGSIYRIYKFDSWSISNVPISTAGVSEVFDTRSKLIITNLKKGYNVTKGDKLEFVSHKIVEEQSENKLFEKVDLYCISTSSFLRKNKPDGKCNPKWQEGITLIHLYDKVVLLDSTGFWWKVQKNNNIGWMSKLDLSLQRLHAAEFDNNEYHIHSEEITPEYTSYAGLRWKSIIELEVLVSRDISPHKIYSICKFLTSQKYQHIYEVRIYFYENSKNGIESTRDDILAFPNNDCQLFIALYTKNPQTVSKNKETTITIPEQIDFTTWE